MTGVPNSGKSEWIDALLCNLARLHGWSFALCSMEKKVAALPLCACCTFANAARLPITFMVVAGQGSRSAAAREVYWQALLVSQVWDMLEENVPHPG